MPDDPKTVADLKKQVADLKMDDNVKKAFESVIAFAEKAEEAAEAAKTEKADAEAVAQMSDAEKAHLETLSEDEAKAFKAKKPEDRAKIVAKAAEKDETVTVGGQEIRKSAVGEAQFAVIKSQQEALDKQAEEIRKANEAREMADLRKRADDEFAHVPGDIEARAKMLKVVGDIEDEELRKAFETVFRQAEKLAGAAFNTVGHGNGQVAEGSAEDKLEKMAKSHAEKNGVDFNKAYDAVLTTDEGRALYKEVISDKPGAS